MKPRYLPGRFFGKSYLIKALGGLFVLGCAGQSVQGQTWTSTSSGNWSSAANWTGGVPSSSTTTSLTFQASGTTSYTATNDVANPFSLASLTLSNTGSGTITIAGGQLLFTGSAPVINVSGNGPSVISAPVSFSNITTIQGTGTGTLTISGAISTPSGSATPGALVVNVPGTVVLTGGGTFNDGTTPSTGGYISVTLGTLSLTSGTYIANYSGTANNLAGLQVNSPSTTNLATIALSNGATLTSPIIYIGRLAGEYGAATVDGYGTTLTSLGQFTVGSRAGAIASLTITNGGVATSTNMANGLTAGAVGTVNVIGTDGNGHSSTYEAPGGYIQLGTSGASTLNITGGGLATCEYLFMGTSATSGSYGILNVSGTSGGTTPIASSFTATGQFSVGGGGGTATPGYGTVTISGGATVTSGGLTLMNQETGGVTGEVSSITVTGTGSSFTGAGQMQMLYGTSNFNVQAGATATINNTVYVAAEASSTATIAVTGTGSLFTASAMQIGGNGGTNAGTGALNVTSNGTATITGGLLLYSPGSITVNSATLNAGYLSDGVVGTSAGNISLTSSTLTTGSANTSSTYTGIISGNGNLVVTGTGTFTLNGLNTYTGTTTINNGTLQVGGSTGTGAISVTGTGTLRGTGTAAGAVTVSSGGTLAAGTATTPGTFTLANGLTTLTNSTIALNLNSNTTTVGGTSTDLFTVSGGSINLGTYTILSINALSGVSFSNAFWTTSETLPSVMTSTTAATVGTAATSFITPYINTTGVFTLVPDGNNVDLLFTPSSQPSYIWTATASGNWSGTANWINSVSPTSSATTSVTFLASGTTSYTATNDIATPLSLTSLTLLNTGTGVITVAGGQLNFTGTGTTANINMYGTGSAVISAPVNLAAITTIGGNGNGTLTISGAITTPSGSATPGALVVNVPGTVILNGGGGVFNDGTTAATGGYIWVELGTLKLIGGSYTMNYPSAANSLGGLQVSSATLATTATVTMSAGATMTSPYVYVGRLANSEGALALDGYGTSLTVATQFTVGSRAGAIGTLSLTNGAVATSVLMANGLSAGAMGTVNVAGTDGNGHPSSYIATGGYIELGTLGACTLNITGGGLATCTYLFMGTGATSGSYGTLNVSGNSGGTTPVASSFTATTQFSVGGGSGTATPGYGMVAVTGGGVITAALTLMNQEAGGVTGEVSSIYVGGTGSSFTSSSSLEMLYGTSTFSVQAGGSASFANTVFAAAETGSNATITVSGSGSSFTAPTVILAGNGGAATGTASLNINTSGTMTVTGGLSIFGGGSITVNSGTLTVGYLSDGSTTSTGNISLTSTTLTTGSANTASTYTGIISGNGNLVVTGTATFTLNGLNTYTGTTTINSGTLQVGGSTGTGAISVTGTGTLRGTGTAAGAVTVASGGTIAAGTTTATGTFTLANGLTTQSGSTIAINLNSNTNTVGGTSTDLFTVSAGTINLNTGSILSINALSGVTYSNSFWSTTETFHSIMTSTHPATVGTVTPFTVSSVGIFTLAADGNNVDLVFTPIPEPSSILALMGLVGISCAALRRKTFESRVVS